MSEHQKTHTPFKKILQKKQSKYSFNNSEWKRFCVDFKDVLVESASIVIVEPHDMFVYKYDLRGYMNHLDVSREYVGTIGIVMMINDIANEYSFHDKKSILIPSLDTVQSVYKQYLNSQTK